MSPEPFTLDARQRMILCGLLFSKYGEQTVQYFNLKSLREGFNLFGFALGGRPGTIRAYRDELDPHVENARRGWDHRPLRKHCRKILEMFGDTTFEGLAGYFTTLLDPSSQFLAPASSTGEANSYPNGDNSFARRLATGRAAEQYFLQHHRAWPELVSAVATDATAWGCGFDFKMDFTGSAPFLLVEVKGLQSASGAISLTKREYDCASLYGPRYLLCVVRNFVQTPTHTLIKNPLVAVPEWHSRQQTQTIQYWTTTI